jgi:hypothetical protein
MALYKENEELIDKACWWLLAFCLPGALWIIGRTVYFMTGMQG